MNSLLRDKENNNPPEENLAVEIRRLWASELKPHFEAEKIFLEKQGEKNGFGRDYVDRILNDQRRMEQLLSEKGNEGIEEFARVLGAYIRYKHGFLAARAGQEGDKPKTSPWLDRKET